MYQENIRGNGGDVIYEGKRRGKNIKKLKELD